MFHEPIFPPAVAAPAGQPALEPPAARPPRRRPGPGCLTALAIVGLLVVALVVGALAVSNLVVKPRVRDMAVAELREGVRGEVAAHLTDQVGAAPSSEVIITEAEINDRLAASDLDPIDEALVRITPDGLFVELQAYQLRGAYHTQVVEQDGSLALEGGDLSGPLSFVIPGGELEAAVNQEIAAALTEAGYVVDAVALADGLLTLTVGQ